MVSLWVFNRFQATFFAVAALWGFSRFLDFAVVPADWLIVPLLATCAYQLNRLSDFEEDRLNHPQDASSALENRRSIYLVSIGSFLGAVVLGLLYANIAGMVLIALLLLLGYMYSFPTIGRDPRLRIKDLFIGKNLAPAIGWAATVVLYPAVNAGIEPGFAVLFCFATIFGGSFILEIICDVRDYPGDRVNAIQSIPVRLGLDRARLVINVMNLLSGLVLVVAVALEILPFLWLLFLANIVLVAFITNAMFDRLASNRLISHALILFQIVQVCLLGVLS